MISEIIESASNVLTAASAVAVAVFAWQGLTTWKSEATGRRRSELAAGALADFYKVRSIIQLMRDPWYRAEEMADETDREGAGVEIYVINKRIEPHLDFLSLFQSRRFEFMAVFGAEQKGLYDEMVAAFNKVINAARTVSALDRRDGETFVAFNRIISYQPNDAMSKEVDGIVAKMEVICRPEIELAAARQR